MMEQTTNLILNAFCMGVLFGPIVWASIWATFNAVFKLFDWLDEKFSNTDTKELHKNTSNKNNENK